MEEFDEDAPYDAIVFLQTIEHVEDPATLLERLASLLAPGGVAYVSTPNRLTLAPAGREPFRQPVARSRVRRGRVPGAARAAFPIGRVARRLSRRQASVCTQPRYASAGTAFTERSGLTERFYGWFVPAISEQDFALRAGNLEGALDFLAVCRR